MGRQQLSIYFLTIAWLGLSSSVFGEEQSRFLTQNQSPGSTLAIPEHDHLLVPVGINRKLSPLEKKRVRTKIIELERQAQVKLAQGDRSGAFSLWFRQLRLQRATDLDSEIESLGRVGKIAWQNNLGAELKVINRRLDEIALQLSKNANRDSSKHNSESLNLLGNAFRQIRDLNQAITTFTHLLTQARQVDEIALEQKYLETLGKLYLGKFAYVEAENVYQELLQLSQFENNLDSAQSSLPIAGYYRQLAQIYNYLQQPKQAISVRKKLIAYYQQQNQTDQLGKIQISLGKDYQALKNFPLAIASYQNAAQLGKSSRQLSLTSEALTKLGSLYLQTKQYELAIQTVRELITTEIEADNSYGVLTSYEQLGKIYLHLKNYPQALRVFTQALDLSRSLNYQIEYFNELVDSLQTRVER